MLVWYSANQSSIPPYIETSLPHQPHCRRLCGHAPITLIQLSMSFLRHP